MTRRTYNILISPFVPFRAAVLLLAYGLEWLAKRIEAIGGAIPGWRRA